MVGRRVSSAIEQRRASSEGDFLEQVNRSRLPSEIFLYADMHHGPMTFPMKLSQFWLLAMCALALKSHAPASSAIQQSVPLSN